MLPTFDPVGLGRAHTLYSGPKIQIFATGKAEILESQGGEGKRTGKTRKGSQRKRKATGKPEKMQDNPKRPQKSHILTADKRNAAGEDPGGIRPDGETPKGQGKNKLLIR